VRANKTLAAVVIGLLLLGAMGAAGCRRVKLADAPGGQDGASNQAQTVPLGAATGLDANVHMAVGSLKLAAGEPSSTLALVASFTYPAPSWKPTVDYSVEGTRGTLTVVQPEVSQPPALGDNHNSWTMKLAAGVPTALSLNLGVGESTVDLRGIDVTALKVVSGVGQTRLDLSGPRMHDVTGTIDSGVGEIDIVVPSGVGVRLAGGAVGVGELSAPGFTGTPEGLVNSAWGSPGPKIQLALSRGVGTIKVTSAD
jgi:N-terminal domain of toast_rack, DUF2154